MELILTGIVCVGLIATIAVLVGIRSAILSALAAASARSAGDVSAALAKSSGELGTAVAKANADLRQDLTDRLNEKFQSVGRDLKEDQKTGRDELREGLSRTTLALEAKFATLESKVNDRLEAIGREVQLKLDKNIQDGFAHFQKIQETLAGAEKQLSALSTVGQSVQELSNVLNMPHLRGKIIGEGNLERLLADFLPAGYYEMQYQIESSLVDAVIKFEHLGLVLPIDSKFSYEQVAPLFDGAADPEALKGARKKLSEIARANARDIKTKYIKPKLGTTDYALMYLPSETLYFEIVRDAALWNALVDCKVFPVSPNTLAITINSIGKSLQYYEMGKSVQKTITQIQRARDHLGKFKDRFDEIGDRLGKAQDSFQKATTHFSNYSSSIDRLESDPAIASPGLPAADSGAPPLGLNPPQP